MRTVRRLEGRPAAAAGLARPGLVAGPRPATAGRGCRRAPDARPGARSRATGDRKVARRYGAWDEFEEVPLHATYLIDRDGNVRWYRVSADPFRDLDFLKTELVRVNRLTELRGLGSDQSEK